MKIIGVIGGMGPLATADLFKKIIAFTQAETDQEHMHVIIDNNTNILDRTAYILGRGESPLEEMKKSVHRLEQAGASVFIMPCNTAHFFYDDLSQTTKGIFLSMLEETAKHLDENYKGKKVGLLATDGTISSKIYEKHLAKYGIEMTYPKQNQAYVMEFIYEGIKKGNYDIGMERLNLAIDEMAKEGAEIFILGCTEFSSATYIYTFDSRCIDPMDILAKRAILEAGGKVKQ